MQFPTRTSVRRARPAVPILATPFDLFDRLFGEFDGATSGDVGDHLPEAFRGAKIPTTNISEDSHRFQVSVELPGLEPEDITLEVIDNTLQISGERKFEEETEEKEFHRIESQYGSFFRSVPLPDNLRTDEVEAHYKSGVLEVSIAKVEPKTAESRRIDIQST